MLQSIQDKCAYLDPSQGIDKEVLEKFLHCLKKLKPRFQDVISLQYIKGLKAKEVSQILEIKGGTVKSRSNTARLQLKDCMGELYPF